MSHIADNPTIPEGFDGQGLVKVFPEHKRQETVYEVVKHIAASYKDASAADKALLIEVGNKLSKHDATRDIANAIHNALSESGPNHVGVDVATSPDANVIMYLNEKGEVIEVCGACRGSQSTIVGPPQAPWMPPQMAPCPDCTKPEGEVEDWMRRFAADTRDYIAGRWDLISAFSWKPSKQGFDYWEARECTKFTDLSPEDQAYVRLIASADGGE